MSHKFFSQRGWFHLAYHQYFLVVGPAQRGFLCTMWIYLWIRHYVVPATGEGLLVYEWDTCYSMISDVEGSFFLFWDTCTLSILPNRKKGEKGYDILYKVRPLIDHLAAVFPKYNRPGHNVNVDEIMIRTRCRFLFCSIFLKNDSIWDQSPDTTRSQNRIRIFILVLKLTLWKKGVGYHVVMKLIEQYQGKGHCILLVIITPLPYYFYFCLITPWLNTAL